jgi:hypothetical protein
MFFQIFSHSKIFSQTGTQVGLYKITLKIYIPYPVAIAFYIFSSNGMSDKGHGDIVRHLDHLRLWQPGQHGQGCGERQ